MAWLQIGRVLTTPMVLLLIIGFVLIEYLLRLSEKSQWTPPDTSDSEPDGDG